MTRAEMSRDQRRRHGSPASNLVMRPRKFWPRAVLAAITCILVGFAFGVVFIQQIVVPAVVTEVNARAARGHALSVKAGPI